MDLGLYTGEASAGIMAPACPGPCHALCWWCTEVEMGGLGSPPSNGEAGDGCPDTMGCHLPCAGLFGVSQSICTKVIRLLKKK